MLDAPPAPSLLQIYRITTTHTRFLSKHQMVQVDSKDLLVTLVSGALSGPSGLASCKLAPAPFRALVVLLLRAPEVASYAMLHASLLCPDECLEAMLQAGSLNETSFQAMVQAAREQLAPLREEVLKKQLVPVRHALGRLNQTLAQKQFGWVVVNRYNTGYMLSGRNRS